MGVFAPAIPATIQYKQQFFQSGVLNPGAHILVVTNVVDGGALYLDYFEVTPGVVSIGTTIPTPLPASTVTTITHGSTGSGQIPYDPNCKATHPDMQLVLTSLQPPLRIRHPRATSRLT